MSLSYLTVLRNYFQILECLLQILIFDRKYTDILQHKIFYRKFSLMNCVDNSGDTPYHIIAKRYNSVFGRNFFQMRNITQFIKIVMINLYLIFQMIKRRKF
jgi:hypothetical protein